jgi:hypothetical protein
MLCFLPPVPAMRRDPLPEPGRHEPARAAQAVILIFVVLNVLFVLTGLLPLVIKMEGHSAGKAAPGNIEAMCAERRSVGLPLTPACRVAHGH